VTKPSKPTIASVQILRFIAALIVVLDHCEFVGGTIADRLKTPFYFPTFPGRLGVDIFFVISGFIMVFISSDGTKWITAPVQFFRNRWTRIVPIYLVATILYVALFFASGNFTRWSLPQYLASAFFIPYFDSVTNLPFPILSQGWTLNFEMFFYALFAISLNFPRRIALPVLSLTFVTLVLIGIVWNLISDAPLVLTPMPRKPDFIVPRFWLHPIILEFLAGVLLAVFRERILQRGQLYEFSFPVMVCVVLIGTYIVLANLRETMTLLPSLTRFGCAVSVVAICVLTRDPAPSTRFQQAIVFLGGCSYSLYLFHPHVVFLMDSVWKRFGAFIGMNVFVPAAVLFSILASMAAYYALETRIIRILRSVQPKFS
jgi:exopolysaccharide production protein ExoZ